MPTTYDKRDPHSSVEKMLKRLISQNHEVGPIRAAPFAERWLAMETQAVADRGVCPT
jgi:hypothetical protein